MEVEAVGSPGFARGEREGKSNSNMAVTLDYGINISVVWTSGREQGEKIKERKRIILEELRTDGNEVER